MGQRIVVFDDLTGETGEDVSPRRFSWAGKEWVVDLSDESFKRLDELLQPYLAVARRWTPEGGKQASHDDDERVLLRAWCAKRGVKFSKGRAPAAVWKAFYSDDLSLLEDHHLTVGARDVRRAEGSERSRDLLSRTFSCSRDVDQ